MVMEIIFKVIPDGFFKAKVAEIIEKNGPYGCYLRIIFTIIQEGDLAHYRFSGFIHPTALKPSKFYRWVTNILGTEPDTTFRTQDMIGKECLVYLTKHNNYYSVKEVAKIHN